jgi:predicted nucleic acid-binding protein
MISVDASVLIAHFSADDIHHVSATDLLTKYQHHEFVISAITLAEFLVGPARTGQLEAARQAIAELDIRTHAMAASAPWRLAELRALTGLKLPDCCVLYTAECHSDSLVSTFDEKLAVQARKLRIGIAD